MPRTLQISDDVYDTLAALKKPGESFTELLRRLTSERKDPTALLRLSGVRADFDLKALREVSRRRDLEKIRGYER